MNFGVNTLRRTCARNACERKDRFSNKELNTSYSGSSFITYPIVGGHREPWGRGRGNVKQPDTICKHRQKLDIVGGGSCTLSLRSTCFPCKFKVFIIICLGYPGLGRPVGRVWKEHQQVQQARQHYCYLDFVLATLFVVVNQHLCKQHR